ncbi:hypothetical protein GCM10008955_40970 [Deinococcus malanensis]|uniref:GGDEF domain-containing protein n=2 Tax=Deinococcus malanensis TaxID=1706855 RepID=A0ABQ2F205_9DEIO|nr:hypothetical protein GCM10008955_40970 [Deinococcus malanensis]
MFYQLSRTVDLNRLLYILDTQIQRLGLFDGYLIAFHDPKRDGLICVRTHLPESHAGMQGVLNDYRFGMDQAVPLVQAYLNGQTLLLHLEDLDPGDTAARQAFAWWQASSLAAVPIPYADGLIGAVNGFRQQGQVDPKAVKVLEEQLQFFNAPLRHALMLGELQEAQAEVEAALEEHRRFLSFVSQINALTSPERIATATLMQLLSAYRFDLGFLSLYEPGLGLVNQHVSVREAHQEVLCDRVAGLLEQPVALDPSLGASVYAFVHNTYLFIPDVDAVRQLPMSALDQAVIDALPEIRTVLHMPIREHGKPLGMIALMSLSQPRLLEPEELKLIELVTSFVGTVITNSRLYQIVEEQNSYIEELNLRLHDRVQRLNETVRLDFLTGLLNFGAFRSELARCIEEANHDGTDLSVVILDIDHFKRLNDTYGHMTGNIVLKELAARIMQVVQVTDFPCRFGGEEFAIILPQNNLEDACTFAERLRDAVAGQPIEADDQTLSLTVSLGCARYQVGETAEEFLSRADHALYRAKAGGRNRVQAARHPEGPSARES